MFNTNTTNIVTPLNTDTSNIECAICYTEIHINELLIFIRCL